MCISEMSVMHGSISSLSRLLHDVSRVYSLLLLKTDNNAARNLLINTADSLHKFVL